MHNGVEVHVLMELSLGLMSRVGQDIGILGGDGCAASGRGSFRGLESSVRVWEKIT